MTAEDERYQRAKTRVQAVKGFYSHLFFYLLVNAGLFVINLVSNPGDWWFAWSLFGWGIGLVAHGLSVLVFSDVFGPDWEQRKIKEYMDKHEGKLGTSF